MNDQVTAVTPVTTEDSAWASVNTPLDVESLIFFCRDIERLFRINPMLEFIEWKAIGDGRYFFSGRNISQEEAFEFEFEFQVKELVDGLRIDYSQGVKTSTILKIEASEKGSKLTITDSYEGISEEERKSRLGEVDKSLITWAHYLQSFTVSWKRWSRFGWWRWYMRRVWQPMKPAGRRITYMLLWISLVEVTLILLGTAIYWSEYR